MIESSTDSTEQFMRLTSLIFINGLYDKTFIITFLFAIKYNKILVFTTAFSALCLISYYSAQINGIIHNYFDYMMIDVFIILFFFVIGLRNLNEGFWAKNTESLSSLDNREITGPDYNISDAIKGNMIKNFTIFFEIFSVIFICELGENTQINTIYLPNNAIKTLFAIILSHLILTVVAVMGGKFLSNSNHMTQKIYCALWGAIFILFAFVSLYLVLNPASGKTNSSDIAFNIEDFLKNKNNNLQFYKDKDRLSSVNIMPDKTKLINHLNEKISSLNITNIK